jgi:hypothetical protein
MSQFVEACPYSGRGSLEGQRSYRGALRARACCEPLLFTRDVVVRDASSDNGADAPHLIRQLPTQKRRMFVLEDGFSAESLQPVVNQLQIGPSAASTLRIVEVRLSAG